MGDVLAESDFQMFQFEEDQIETNDSNNLEHRKLAEVVSNLVN